MLDTLLELQTRDTAIDRLTHRRDTLPERAALESVRAELTAAGAQLAEQPPPRPARSQQRLVASPNVVAAAPDAACSSRGP